MFLKIIFLIILVILFFHIFTFCKIKNDFLINEMKELNDIHDFCKEKIPFLFNYDNSDLTNIFNYNYIGSKFNKIKLNLFETKENVDIQVNGCELRDILNNEKNYLSLTNESFLIESNLVEMLYNETLFHPFLKTFSYFDICFGSPGVNNKLNVCNTDRTFLYVTQGTIKIKLVSPNSQHLIKKETDIWDPLINIKNIKINLEKNMIVYVPPFWYYSIQFEKNSLVCLLKYDSLGSTSFNVINNIKTYFNQFMN